MPFYVFAWISTICSGLYVVTTKLTSKHSLKNPWLFNFLSGLFTLLFAVPISLLYKAGMPHDWFPIILVAIFGVLWNILFIFSTYLLDVTIISPLFNFRSIFAVLFSALLLHEKLTSFQVLLFFIIVIAGIFVTIDEKMSIRSFFKPAVALGILTMFFLALSSVFSKPAILNNDIWTVNLWSGIIGQIFLLPTILFFKKEIKLINVKQVLPVIAMGLFLMLANITANYAYKVNVGITTIIEGLPISMILAYLFSIFAPKLLEKHTFKVYLIRFTASAIMIISAIQLSQ